MIYFMRHAAIGPVKIGYTMDLEWRAYTLSRDYRVPLAPIRVIPHGRRWMEIWLHKEFGANRITGEWFSYDQRMLTIEPPQHPLGLASDYSGIYHAPSKRKGHNVHDIIHGMIAAEMTGVTQRDH